ncbi:putative permease of the major facilitator superfamily [Pseudohyphozyma bogoriensis]|nr:putative permease of the major facilitator superfamily [Pseudohyphozyma bogoriensis]
MRFFKRDENEVAIDDLKHAENADKNSDIISKGGDRIQVSEEDYYAQLGAQPLAAFFLVKFPFKWSLPFINIGMGGSHDFTGLAVSRFFLGWFEAMCVPIFSLMTVAWYRRSEQPMRIAAWYSMNGWANILGAPLAYGIGHIRHGKIYSWQILFMLCGAITVISGIVCYFVMDNSVSEARFLSEEDRQKGVERLRANNTGVVSTDFKWRQVLEMALEPKTYLFAAMTFCLNLGASVSSTFGPLLLKGLVGFDAETAVLLNIPYGALQFLLIFLGAWLAYRFKNKSGFLLALVVPVIWGTAIMYKVPRVKSNQGVLLFGYYSLAFLFAGNPLIISWISANTAGQSKKTAVMCLYNAASAAGNIVGPYLFKSADAPNYIPGLKATFAVFCALLGVVALQIVNFMFLNKRKEAQRVRNGKPAKLTDYSMSKKFEAQVEDAFGADAFADKTDQELDEFIYLL